MTSYSIPAAVLNPSTPNLLQLVTSFWDLLSTASVVLALSMAAGMGLMRGVVISLRERLKDVTEERDDLKAKHAEDQATIRGLRADLAALSRVVTGEVHWQTISEHLDHHQATAESHWERIEAMVGRVLDQLRNRGPG